MSLKLPAFASRFAPIRAAREWSSWGRWLYRTHRARGQRDKAALSEGFRTGIGVTAFASKPSPKSIPRADLEAPRWTSPGAFYGAGEADCPACQADA